MKMKHLKLLNILHFLIFVQANDRVLVLLDNPVIKETHSRFFSSLQDRGYELTLKMADDVMLTLSTYGEYLYEHLIIFAPSVDEFGGNLNLDVITKFIDNGGNVLVAANSGAGDVLRELAAECGLEMDEEDSYVIDHLSYDSLDEGQHTRLAINAANLIKAPVIVGPREVVKPLLYQGTGIVTDTKNPLLLPLLTADSTSYSAIPEQSIKQYPQAIGKNAILIAGLQAQNNARIVFSGSLSFFSDEFFNSSVNSAFGNLRSDKSGNERVSLAISQWVFNESGQLRAVNVNHHKLGEANPPHEYTITDDVVYSLEIEVLENATWKPFIATDIQLEFVRIDPFIRTMMTRKPTGEYEAHFRIPDVYGVYQFKIDYDRIGYSKVYTTKQVSVRPLEHTQYERFIKSAYPYYSGAFSMLFGLFVFSFVFLHFRNDEKKN